MAGRPKRRARLEAEALAAGLPMPTKYDYRAELAEKLVKAMEAGTAPWQRSWEPGRSGLPHNPFSGDEVTAKETRGYRGINRLMLMASPYDDDRWCTAKQAKDRDIELRPGEASRGTTIEVWKSYTPKDDREKSRAVDEKKKDDNLDRSRMGVRYYTLYNAEQFENFPAATVRPMVHEWEAVERAERIVKDSGVAVHHNAKTPSPYYSPSADHIVMPTRTQFPSASAYYDTLMHETVHSTGHPSRLKRDQSGGFGTPAYAREELVAEIGSLFLSAETELPHNVERHASYVSNWIQVIREDKHAIPRAAAAASVAVDRIMELERTRERVIGREKPTELEQKNEAEVTPSPSPGIGAAAAFRLSLNAKIKDKFPQPEPKKEIPVATFVREPKKEIPVATFVRESDLADTHIAERRSSAGGRTR